MSGPGKNGDPYRCDACRRRKNRCEECRALRQSAKRELLARKRAEGICLECTEPVVEEQARCEHHQAINRERSRLAHQRRRAKQRKRKAA